MVGKKTNRQIRKATESKENLWNPFNLWIEMKKPARTLCSRGLLKNNRGDFLLSHAVSRAVPSAPTGLTCVFGMVRVCRQIKRMPDSLNPAERL